ncbi:MAG: hypothetical protein ACUZ8E_14845 [Candidatus Anammoxibacter sp.]
MKNYARSRAFLITLMLFTLFSIKAQAQHNEQYTFKYPKDFFYNDRAVMQFNPSKHRKIGVLIQNQTNRSLPDIVNMIFNTSPFDRYKHFFYFRIVNELNEDMANNNVHATRAYDYSGKPISGGLSATQGNGAFNMTFIKFGLQDVIRCSCKGVTISTNQGNFAFVGEDSILHEIGHAFAGLADEYSHPAASEFMAINIEDRNARMLKWNGLLQQGFLPNKRVKRVELINGVDKGRFLIPSDNCYMNNHGNPKDNRYCPVCQIAIIDRISQLASIETPWR